MFGKKRGRKDISGWTAAVISNCHGKMADLKQLEQATELLIQNDCRIIRESAEIIGSTKNPGTRASRLSLVEERLSHLDILEPYADKNQEKLIANARSSVQGFL
ncbi:MAG: hypothetical protein LUE24_15160 [Lachnospiraceae bacterium]|nr:hypothetical protein [Lachnospiraceae bacterium]